MADALDRGRGLFRRNVWGCVRGAVGCGSGGDARTGGSERLAVAAYLVGADADSDDAWLRAHRECLRLGDVVRAAAARAGLLRDCC